MFYGKWEFLGPKAEHQAVFFFSKLDVNLLIKNFCRKWGTLPSKEIPHAQERLIAATMSSCMVVPDCCWALTPAEVGSQCLLGNTLTGSQTHDRLYTTSLRRFQTSDHTSKIPPNLLKTPFIQTSLWSYLSQRAQNSFSSSPPFVPMRYGIVLVSSRKHLQFFLSALLDHLF